MSTLVTQTRITAPLRRPDLLSRQRLLDMMDDFLDFKLIIVAAPAGYGKTSFLIDFAQQVDIPVCWYSLDALDDDLHRFLAHYIASIQKRFPSFGDRSAAMLDSVARTGLNLDQLVTTIVNDIYENVSEHFIFIMDDYHQVSHNGEIDAFVNRFIQKVDDNCHLVLSSRTLLTLADMPLMVARSQVSGLSFEELSFRPEEIRSLAMQNYGTTISEQVSEDLARETEGWITGLLLSTHSLWGGKADQLRIARVSGVGLYDYLAQQVLDQQPAQVREFLLRTSIMDEFDVDLCQVVLGENPDTPLLMGILMRDNLFVLPVGEGGRWIRYHHLFRDFLQACLTREYPHEIEQIQYRLARAYIDREEWDKAYAIYMRLFDLDSIAELIDCAGSSLLKSGRLLRLTEWLDDLPDEMITSRSTLVSLRGAVYIMQGQPNQGLSWLARAERAQRASGRKDHLALTLSRKAAAHRFLGDYQASLENASEAYKLTEQDESLRPVQAEALRAIGLSQYHIGRLDEAIEKMKLSCAAYEALNDRHNVALVLMELGISSRSAGRYQQALGYYDQVLKYWREAHNFVGQTYLLNNLGVLHSMMGNYEQAGLCFEEALSYAKQSGDSRMEAYLICGIGDLYAELDAFEAALSAYNHALELAQQVKDRSLILYVDVARAVQCRRTGDFRLGEEILISAQEYLQEGNSLYERGLWNLETGLLCLVEGNIHDAINHLRMAAQSFEQADQGSEVARTYLYLACAYHMDGDTDASMDALDCSVKIASSLESQHLLLITGRDLKHWLQSVQKDPGLGDYASRLLARVVQFEECIPSIRRILRPNITTIQFAPPKLNIQALGRGSVRLDGEPVNAVQWDNQRRVREFFFYLLEHPYGLKKEEIGSVFWPDSSASKMKIQFKNTVYRLRYALGKEVVTCDGDIYAFNRELDYEYDVEVFQEKINHARSVIGSKEKMESYKTAVDLYSDHYLLDSDSTWVLAKREQLWQMYLEGMFALARFRLEQGQFEVALEFCQRILREDNCQEEAHRLAMQAYADKGDRAGFVQQYELCRQALKAEINARPSPQTEQLFKRLMGE